MIFYLFVLDAVDSIIKKVNLILTEIKLVKLNYSSKILDIINISSLISARDVKSKIPEEYCDYDIEIINKYNNPIGSRICNYNKILENLSEDDINDNRPCICERNSTHNKVREFIYSPVGHVVTGNLGIVDKLGNLDQLKRVLQLGYKYRVQSSNVTWGRIKRSYGNCRIFKE